MRAGQSAAVSDFLPPVAQVGEMPILSQNSRDVHYGNEKTK